MGSPSRSPEILLGVSGNLRPGGSIHKDALVLGIESACRAMAEEGIPIRTVSANDDATRAGGAAAAESLLDAGVDAVVGHFASAAAWGACETYRKAGVPVLLPAASDGRLTAVFPSAFRFCASDDAYMRILAHILGKASSLSRIGFAADDSDYAARIALAVPDILARASEPIEDEERAPWAGAESDALLYAGSYANLLAFIDRNRKLIRKKKVFLSDDAVTADAARTLPLSDAEFYVLGPAMAPGRPCYFAETFAAVEMAPEILRRGKANPGFPEDRFASRLLGGLRFRRGENMEAILRLHKVVPAGLQAVADFAAGDPQWDGIPSSLPVAHPA